MKKIFITGTLGISSIFFAQVGVNTADPKATFDINAKEKTGTSRNVEGLLIPRVDRERAQSMTGVETSTMIYVSDASTGAQTGTAINIDKEGYYFYDGKEWVKLNEGGNNTNIYNADGAIGLNRTVTMADKNLSFNATKGSFSVNGDNDGLTRSTFKNISTGINSRADIHIGANTANVYMGVDTGTGIFGEETKAYLDNRTGGAFIIGSNTRVDMTVGENVGIGTRTPLAKFDIIGDKFGLRRGNETGSWDNMWFDVSNASAPSINASGAETGLQFKVGKNVVGTYGDKNQVLETVATMTPTGNVGIGTASPTNKLHVVASTPAVGTYNLFEAPGGVNINDSGILMLKNTSIPALNNTAALGFSNNGPNSGGPNWQIGSIRSRDNANAGDDFFFSASNGAEQVERFRINSNNGNVGIGTSTPSEKLDVAGKIKIVDGTQGANKVLTSDADGVATWKDAQASADTNIYNADGTITGDRTVTQGANKLAFTGTSANAFSVDGNTFSVNAANNRVGIGTASPTNKLHVVASTPAVGTYNLFEAPGGVNINDSGILMLKNTSAPALNNIAALGFSNNGPTSGGPNWQIGSIRSRDNANAGDDFYFSASNGTEQVERFRINSNNGNVGIGTSTPSEKLDVAGKIKIVDGTQGANKVLTSDADGVATWKDAPVSADTNIYNTNGTLASNRTVTLDARNLTLNATTGNFSVVGSNNGLTRSTFRNANTEEASRADINIGANTANIYMGVENGSGAFGTTTKAYLDNRTGGSFVIGSNNRTDINISATGNVGIGDTTTAPAQKLTVLDSGDTNKYSGIASFMAKNLTRGISIGYNGIQATGSEANAEVYINGQGSGGVFMQTLQGAGNVGVGTTNPAQKLDIEGTARLSQTVTANNPGRLMTVKSLQANTDTGQITYAPNGFPKASGGYRPGSNTVVATLPANNTIARIRFVYHIDASADSNNAVSAAYVYGDFTVIGTGSANPITIVESNIKGSDGQAKAVTVTPTSISWNNGLHGTARIEINQTNGEVRMISSTITQSYFFDVLGGI